MNHPSQCFTKTFHSAADVRSDAPGSRGCASSHAQTNASPGTSRNPAGSPPQRNLPVTGNVPHGKEADDFPVGSYVETPTGRRAIVLKHLSGASKVDCFTRIICRYEGGHAKDLVTLQPHHLRQAEDAPRKSGRPDAGKGSQAAKPPGR